MIPGKPEEQVVAISERAFDAFVFEEAITAPKEIFYPKKLVRDTAAREDFRKEKGSDSILTEKKKSRLTEIRKARGFTQLSDASDVSLRMIPLYKQKQCPIPNRTLLLSHFTIQNKSSAPSAQSPSAAAS